LDFFDKSRFVIILETNCGTNCPDQAVLLVSCYTYRLDFVDADFAGEDVSKGGKCIVQLFVVDGFVQVLDENISDP